MVAIDSEFDTEKSDEASFVYSQEAKNVLAYLFLKDFHDRFTRTLDKISAYLSEYDKYNSYFGATEREEIIRSIKQDLLSVIYILNSIRLDPECRRELNFLITRIDEIINSVILTKDQLKQLLRILSKIIAISFLKDLIKYVPRIEERIKGDFD